MKTTLNLNIEVIDNTHGNFIILRANGWVIGTIKHMLGTESFKASYTGGERKVTSDMQWRSREAAAQWIIGKAAANRKLTPALTYTQGDHNQPDQHTGFADSTYTAICALVGVDRDGANTGLKNRLHDIFRSDFATRKEFTIGEVFDALANNLLDDGEDEDDFEPDFDPENIYNDPSIAQSIAEDKGCASY